MSSVEHVLCGKCQVPAQIIGDIESDASTAVCPRCGRRDTVGSAKKEAAEYLGDYVARKAEAELTRVGNSPLDIGPLKRTYRWTLSYL